MINYQNICTILAELWSDYRSNPDLKEFVEYNDLGLPLAYALAEGLVKEITEIGQPYVIETFELFISALNIDINKITDDMTLSDLFDLSEK
jgi:hypothetical protein